jgi:rRNA-processing protein FCF1
MKKIILDTNFLLIPYQSKVDVFSEIKRICDFKYRLYVIDKTVDELKKIMAKQKGKHRMSAMLGLVFIEQNKIAKIKTKEQKNVDSLIIGKADENTIVATQDAGLKRRLKKKGIGLIVMKGKAHLALLES